MRPVAKKRAIDHVTPRLGPERVARMWSTIEGAQRKSARPIVGMALVAACLLAFAIYRMWPAEQQVAHAPTIVPSAPKTNELRLPDDSMLTTSDASELRVLRAEPEEVELQLLSGSLYCDVSHRTRRRFAVHAGDVTVLVRGTAFTVEALDSGVSVRVQRGVVEVRGKDDALLATLSAGQAWTQHPVAKVEAPPAPLAKPEKPRRPTAQALLERANEARLAGDARTAADLYQQLRTQYPRDPRAGLSAFELARVSLHALHDPARALAALRFARAHGGGFVREDADVLEVEALAQTGEDCAQARARFLREHPASAQRARVERACP